MNDWNRRRFLSTLSVSTLAALSGAAPILRSSSAAEAVPAKADSMILLWMGGAMSQTETFDPKPYQPFEKGLDIKKLICTCPTIDTVVDSIKFAAGVENLAKVIDRGTVLRSYVARDYGALAEDLQHIPFQYKWHTGYTTPSTVAAPFIGSWIARALGAKNPDIPPYIEIGRDEKTTSVFLSLGAFQAAGFLGSEFAPLMIPDPNTATEAIRARLPVDRFEDRYSKFKQLAAASPLGAAAGSFQQESLLKSLDNAYRLMHSPAVKALELSQEPANVREKYGSTTFGQGCLLARRLVEEGARFVEVHVDFENAKGWDTHGDGHNGQAAMKAKVDGPVAQLILDLEQRGLLDRTLVVLATEFGRASLGRGSSKVKTVEKMEHYGLHGHFSSAASFLLFGGSIRKGNVYGKTNNEFPCETVENPVTITDLHATLYHALGIAPNFQLEVEKRPFYITKDGLGKPISGLLET